MEIRILGSVSVVASDDLVGAPLGAAQRRLLAALAVDAGSLVTTDRLVELLAISEGALRSTVTRLRRVVGPDVLHTEHHGYCLAVASIDATHFEAEVARAQHLEPVGAAALLRVALRRWHGPALAEFAHEDWARPDAVRLTELRAVAGEGLADALLALGHHGDAVVVLDRMRAEFPLRDRLRALLMEALALGGRRAEALRAFQEYRTFLAEEVGMAPSRALRELDAAIARGDGPGDAPVTRA